MGGSLGSVDGCSPAHNITTWVEALGRLDGPPKLLENCGDNGLAWSPPALEAVRRGVDCGFQMYPSEERKRRREKKKKT